MHCSSSCANVLCSAASSAQTQDCHVSANAAASVGCADCAAVIVTADVAADGVVVVDVVVLRFAGVRRGCGADVVCCGVPVSDGGVVGGSVPGVSVVRVLAQMRTAATSRGSCGMVVVRDRIHR